MQPQTRLNHARVALGEEIAAVSRRIGVAERLLQAIEDGRFEDLPRGIYGRAAIRSYAAAVGLDPTEILTACEALLPALEDPIGGLGRLRGLRQPRLQARQPEPEIGRRVAAQHPDWRMAAAAAIDAGVIGVLLVAVVASASLVAGVPLAALSSSALSFGLITALLAGSYFVWLGGMIGATGGQRWIRRPSSSAQAHCVNLRGIAIGALSCATEDLRFIRDLGVWIGGLAKRISVARTPLATIGSRARSSVG